MDTGGHIEEVRINGVRAKSVSVVMQGLTVNNILVKT